MAIDSPAQEYRITKARIVAMIEGGGVVVEHRDLTYQEGRLAGYAGIDQQTPQLLLNCGFTVLGSALPDVVEMNRARMVVEGDCDGQRIEIRGSGHFGYTDAGLPEGSFSRPPAILLDVIPELPASEEPDMSPEEWQRTIGTKKVVAPNEYRRAQRAIDAEERVSLDDEGDEEPR